MYAMFYNSNEHISVFQGSVKNNWNIKIDTSDKNMYFITLFYVISFVYEISVTVK